MKSILTSIVAFGLLVSLASAASVRSVAPAAGPDAQAAPLMVERGWVAAKGTNLCGLRELDQLSNPAKLNYTKCLAATPEMKKMREDGIRPTSPKGIQLRNAAATRVSRAANTIRRAGGFCSVWKAIKHTDGRDVSDITARVISQI